MAARELPDGLLQRVQPLLEVLQRGFGSRLGAVIAYGPDVAVRQPSRGEAVSVLVVINELTAAGLLPYAQAISQSIIKGLEPLFIDRSELVDSLDVFPLEFLEMQSSYVVVHGSDLLADLEFPPVALRLQVEEALRGASHWLRQEAARYGHRTRPLRTTLQRSIGGLSSIARGLIALAGETVPAAPEALLQAVAVKYQLDAALLSRLRDCELGAWQPGTDELPELLASYDGLLTELIAAVDGLET